MSNLKNCFNFLCPDRENCKAQAPEWSFYIEIEVKKFLIKKKIVNFSQRRIQSFPEDIKKFAGVRVYMCGKCWDAKVFADKIMSGLCTGEEMQKFDLNGLKIAVKEEWHEHPEETDYYVFRKALTEPVSEPSIQFPAYANSRKQTLTIHFV